MTRIILIYGILAGTIAISLVTLGATLGSALGGGSIWFGYLIMFAALSLVFAGIKRYRDSELHGMIRFWAATGVGLGIALVSGVAYAAGWEAYLWLTNYSFFPQYAQAPIEAKRATGASSAEIAIFTRNMAAMGEQYAHPLYRMKMTLFEILPVGVIMAFISAALLRNGGLLSHRGNPLKDG